MSNTAGEHSVSQYRIRRIAELRLTAQDTVLSDATADVSHIAGTVPVSEGSTTKGLLVGKFVTKREAEKDHPTSNLSKVSAAICFSDSTGAVPCEFSNFQMSWLGQLVCLVRWSFVPVLWALPGTSAQRIGGDLAYHYLEVLDVPLVLADGHFLETHWSYQFSKWECDVEQEWENSRVAAKDHRAISDILSKRPPVCFPSDFASPRRSSSMQIINNDLSAAKIITVCGRVRGKSMLTFPRGQTCYFVEIQCSLRFEPSNTSRESSDTIITAFVLYRDSSDSLNDILPYYESTCVGSTYILVDVRTTQVKIPLSNGTCEKRRLLVFSLKTSKMFCLDGYEQAQIPQLPSFPSLNNAVRQEGSESVPSPIGQTESGPTSLVTHRPSYYLSYTGKITKILDLLLGIYEIDGQHHLYSTFHYLPGLGRGLRVGAELEMRNVHMISCDAVIPRPGPADKDSVQHHRIAFVACPCSTLKVRAFSTERDPCRLSPNSYRKRAMEAMRLLNIPDLTIACGLTDYLNELESSTASSSRRRKWDVLTTIPLLKHFGYAPYETDLHAILLNHDSSCKLARWRYPFPDIVTIAHITSAVASRAGGADNRHAQPTWTFHMSNAAHLGMKDSWLIAWLEGGRGDHLRLRDSSGTILTVVEGAVTDTLSNYANRLFGIRNFELVTETFGGFDVHGTRGVLTTSYLRWSLRDAFCVTESPPSGPRQHPTWASFVFVPQLIGPRTAKIAYGTAGIIQIVDGMSWMVVRGNSVGEGRSTCIEVNPSGEGRQTWNLDATYLVTGAQLVGGIGNRTHPDSAGGPAFYKMTASTIVSSLAEPEGGTATTSNMAGTTSNQATNTFQLAKYDADRIALARTHPIFRSVGAVINRHVDTQAGPDTFQDYLVNLEGILEHREFRDKEADAFLSVDMAKALFETHTFGSGRNDRILFIRLRDKEDPETIGVYLDMRLHPYPVGLLPGALVQFQRLAIRMSGRGALYGHHIANTSITVSNPPLQPDTATKPTDEPPVPVHLHSFLPPHRTPCHVKLDITFVQEITIGPICTLCGSKPQHAGCPNACPAAHQTLQASARAFAQDGTCEALLYLDDRDTVFALLRVLAGPGSGGEAVLGRLVRAEKEVRFVQTPPWFADDGGGGNGRGAGTAGGERDEDMDAAGRGDEYFPAAANSRGSRAVGAHLADRDTDLQEVLTTYCQHLDLRRPVLARCRRVMRHRGPAEEFRKRTFKVANIAVPTIAHQRLLLKVLHMEGLDVKNEISRLTKILAARRIAIASGGDQ